jgi:branched-chain amino acid transport system substrate-binding protein
MRRSARIFGRSSSTGHLVWLPLALALVACGGGSDDGDAITFGAIFSVSGNKAQPGQGELQSVQLAVDEINAAGGIAGRKIKLVNHDDHSTEDGARSAAQDLVASQHAPVIFGLTAPETTLAAANVTMAADTILISDIASGPKLNNLADADTVFTTAPDRSHQGEILAARAFAKGFKKAAVVFVDLPLHTETASGFVSKFTSLGGTVTTNQVFAEGQTSYTSLLDKIYGDGAPDCILLNAEEPEGTQVIKDYLVKYAGKQTFWFFNPALGNPGFFEGVGYSNFTFQHEGIDVADGPAIDVYTASFEAHYPGSTVQAEPGSYDDVYLVALAMLNGGKFDADTVKANIRLINDPAGMRILPGQFAMAAAVIKAGGKINYDGASGPCDFDSAGSATAANLIWSGFDGQERHVTVPLVE